MLDLYYWPTPNGHKITLFLEETGAAYRIIPVNIGAGEQFDPDFLKIAPNNRMPAIVDHDPADGGAPLSLFESGVILEYLAEKTGQLLPRSPRERFGCLQWLYWQMGGFGPMLGQNHHFRFYAPEPVPYAVERYGKETLRLYGVLDDQLRGRDFITGSYSIADIACYPWAVPYERQGVEIDEFPNVKAWMARIGNRDATRRAYEIGPRYSTPGAPPSDQARKILFGQGRIAKP